jgi:hypothetical protein
MSDPDNLKAINDLVMQPSAEYERLAKIRERQRRERKDELYSYHPRCDQDTNKRDTLA